jgi:hypothetical protein
MATEEFVAKFFANGTRPGGVLEAAGVVKDPSGQERRGTYSSKGAATDTE